MKQISRSFFYLIVALLLVFNPLISMSLPAHAQGTDCSISSPPSGTYTVTLCFSEPFYGATLMGDSTITATISVTGTSPGVQRIIYYIDGAHLLVDYESPYTFTLPTAKWVDGSYTLAVEALMRDAFVTPQALISVNFDNGVISPPVNTNQFEPTSGRPASGAPFVVAASGDGAGGQTSAADVANLASSRDPNLFLYLGDVYEKGSPTEFYNWYGTDTTFFGQLRSITNPTVGNHEYTNGVAAGYFDYWDNIPNYYSYDAGGWHFISLNSNSFAVGTDPQSPQYQWLQQDLAAHAGACTIVYYHHPLFNIGMEGPSTSMSDIWALMAQYGVSIALTGHDHNYQRWVALDGNGQPSATGITQFVNGAGGHGVRPFATTDSRVAYSNDIVPTALGVLFLQLNTAGVNFSYENTAGAVLDSGVIPCAKKGSDTQAPSVPTGLSATAVGATIVDLSWSASSDNTGVSGYTVYRDGTAIATVPGSSLAYTDKSALPKTTYQYRVDAFDLAGHHSAASSPVSVTTPSMPPTLTFPVGADTYVSAEFPLQKYGSATVLRVDAAPDVHSYLRFTVEGLAGYAIGQARLRVYANNTSNLGIDAHAVADNSWDELNTPYPGPALGNVLASSGAFTGGSWVDLDVTSYVTGEGTYSFGLTTTGISTLTFPSRESGSNAAQLLIVFQDPSLDIDPPTVPNGLTATAINANQVDLSWSASTDNVAVTGYTIYRGGTSIATVSNSTLSYSDVNASPGTSNEYSVDAFDAAGNHSAQSDPAAAITPGIPSSLTFIPVADTYVDAGNPNNNNGSLPVLRASPAYRSYLRFNIQGSGGAPVTRALLRIYPNSSTANNLVVQAVADNTWGELTTTYNNAPALGSILASVQPVTSGSWLEFDVTSYVTGNGLLSFGVTTTGSTQISLASRESVNAPQLIVDFEAGPTNQAPVVNAGPDQAVTLPDAATLDGRVTDDGLPNLPGSVTTTWSQTSGPGTVTFANANAVDTTASFSAAGVYTLRLTADDGAADASDEITITVSNPPGFFTFNPEADAYVNEDKPRENKGSDSKLLTKAESGKRQASFMRFNVAGLSGNVAKATLYLFARSDSNVGVEVRAVPDNSWSESSITWNNQPSYGALIARSSPTKKDDWTEIDVTSLITGPGQFSLVLLEPADKNEFKSRESDRPPLLMIETGNSPAAPTVTGAVTLNPEADAYVNEDKPNENKGSDGKLLTRAESGKRQLSFMRFNVAGLSGNVAKATLYLFARGDSNVGVEVRAVPDNSWSESSITWNNQPSYGALVARSSPTKTDTWIEIDVTSLITGPGQFSLVLLEPADKNEFKSRESDRPPLLVVTTGN